MEGFSVKVLERRLLRKGVLMQAKFSNGDDDENAEAGDSGDSEDELVRKRDHRRAIRSGNARLRSRDSDDDDDWD